VYDYAQFNTKINKATWSDDDGLWHLEITDLKAGKDFKDTCNVLLNCSGLLSQPRYPPLPHMKSFKGPIMHTAEWDDSTDFTGKRIALVGAGSSAIQTLPALQKAGAQVDMYIKSSTWVSLAELK
jgi:cation diffusion facilitator CzcD-associated flavoprotein CzcO